MSRGWRIGLIGYGYIGRAVFQGLAASPVEVACV
jgi:phosphoglycerate dehydrogenase-like enzyme